MKPRIFATWAFLGEVCWLLVQSITKGNMDDASPLEHFYRVFLFSHSVLSNPLDMIKPVHPKGNQS